MTSFQNSKVKQVRKLRDKKWREREGLFVIDDPRDLQRALDCGYTAAHIFYCADRDDDSSARAMLPNTQIYEIPRDILDKISYRQTPSPIVAVMQQPAANDLSSLDTTIPLILCLVNLRKPGNIGALLRTADASGFEAILLIDTALDIYNPNIIRSSTGASFLNNIYTASSQHAYDLLHAAGYSLIAAVVDGDTPLPEVDFQRKSAVLLGTEDDGLDAFWQSHCDIGVQIPMVGQLTDSFNVSVSGALFMYEALRQSRW